MRLNLGAGEKIKKSTETEEWLNLDIKKLDGIDIVCDLTKERIPLDDNSIDYIIANDIMEHFSKKELVEVLLECNRILKENSELEIKTPDLLKIISAYPITISDFEISRKIMGNQTDEFDHHKICFTKESLEFYLNMCGFKVTKKEDMSLNDWSNMNVIATKPFLNRWLKPQIEDYSIIKRSRDILTTPRAIVAIGLIKEQDPIRLLDLGMQDGWLERGLRKNGYTKFIVGQDLPEVIKAYNYSDIENFKALGRNIEEGIPKEQYGCICLFEIIEHLLNPYKLLKQIREVITDDGLLLITTPDGKEASKRHTDHFGWFDIKRLQILLSLTGFRLDTVYKSVPETLFVSAKPILSKTQVLK